MRERDAQLYISLLSYSAGFSMKVVVPPCYEYDSSVLILRIVSLRGDNFELSRAAKQ